MVARPTTTTDVDLLAAIVPAARITAVATVIEALEAREIPTTTSLGMGVVRPGAARPWKTTVPLEAEEATMTPTDGIMDLLSHTPTAEADLRTSALLTMDLRATTCLATVDLLRVTAATLAAAKTTAEAAAEAVVVEDTGNSFHFLSRGSSLTLSRSLSAFST